ncbi:D-sedoheptulose-7-phosphate isomerase [Erysipelothrix aquatica]|uniref:D-sedoheptulose-7-phosphate isomerase n=1 Tax=Erysipelothrix aquatica TaxID=2683714 RepID=UPI0013595D88|nr:SIS domain-containing protein [Erysipelothrix aquatica]
MYQKILLDDLVSRYTCLSVSKESIWNAFIILRESYESSGKLIIAGNGGSASDSNHIVGELMKGFNSHRKLEDKSVERFKDVAGEYGVSLAHKLQGSLPAISLSAHTALISAVVNDVDGDMIYAQQVYGYGNKNDVFLGISTSGNALNVYNAAVVAKERGMKVIALTGEKASRLSKISDLTIRVPEVETFKIQELHLPVYHTLCLMLESYFFDKVGDSDV